MRLIIAGSRHLVACDIAAIVARSGFKLEEIGTVVTGCAAGVDRLGAEWAVANAIQVKEFPVTREAYAAFRGAAPRHRNEAMAAFADGLIAVWDGRSPGTRHMIEIAMQYGLQVYVERVG